MAETTIKHGILISLHGTQDFTIAASFVYYDLFEEKIRDCFYLLASLAKAISGRWKLDTDMMMCKKSSDAHLFSHDIIDFRGKQCTVFSPICTMLFGNCAIVPFILSLSKCQFYRRWTSGIYMT